jgi:hypothetical protein
MRATLQKSGSPLGSERAGDLLHSKGHMVAVRTGLMFEAFRSAQSDNMHSTADGEQHIAFLFSKSESKL